MVYEPRTYRSLHKEEDLRHFQVVVGETDLDIAVKKNRYFAELPELVEAFLRKERRVLQEYLSVDPGFQKALSPYEPLVTAPEPAREMAGMARLAGVGPMAAVAGLFAEKTGKMLARYSGDVIVENGGDIWLKTSRIRRVGIYAGDSPFSGQVGLKIRPAQTPLGICTSSGTVGHSLSFGQADAVIILAPSALLADAVATAAANQVQDFKDLEAAVDFALNIPGVTGAIAIKGDRMAVRGQVTLAPM